MIEKLQQFLRTTGGQIAAGALFVLALAFVGYSYWNASAESRFVAGSNDRIFICSETGKSFHYTIKMGDSVPVKSPHSGKATGYPAELCYWTADGKTKPEPTPVLLNSTVGKPGATFCPNCGRRVVAFNPAAVEGMTPPPKKSDIKPGRERALAVDENRGD